MAIHDDGQTFDSAAQSQMRLGIESIMPHLNQHQETHLSDAPITTPTTAQSSPAPAKTYLDLLDRPGVNAKLSDDLIAAPGRIAHCAIAGGKELWNRITAR